MTHTKPVEAAVQLPSPSWIGIAVALCANACVLVAEWSFAQAAKAIPPGTLIRPIAVTLVEGIATFAGALVGMPLCMLGAYLARMEGRRLGVCLGAVGIILSLAPSSIGRSLFNRTVTAAGILIEK